MIRLVKSQNISNGYRKGAVPGCVAFAKNTQIPEGIATMEWRPGAKQ